MIDSAPKDFKILLLDVKKPRDYEGLGVEIPIYLEDRTEPVGLKNLLESTGKMGLKFEFSELIKVCKTCAASDKEGRYGFREVLSGINEALKQKIHPIRESKLLVLQHLLSRLVKQLDETQIADELSLPGRINVMNLSNAPPMVKQLAVYSTFNWVLERLQNVLLGLDELPDFAPQRHGTPAREIIVDAVRKGGASGIWCWFAGQTITGVDKAVLKECNYWILGRQREKNEAQRTLDQIPFKTGLDWKDIMKLPVGHFVVVSEDAAYITYVQPLEIDSETAKAVALDKLSVKEVSKVMKKKERDEEAVYKEKYEEEHRIRTELEKTLGEYSDELNKLRAKLKDLTDKFAERDQQVTELRGEVENLKKQNKSLEEDSKRAVEKIHELNKQLHTYNKLSEALGEIILPVKSDVQVFPKKMTLEHREMVVDLGHTEETVKMDTKTQQGQIMYVAIKELPREGFTEKEMSEALQEHGWNIPHTSLSPHLSTNLVKQGLIIKIPRTRPQKYRLPSKLKINVAKND